MPLRCWAILLAGLASGGLASQSAPQDDPLTPAISALQRGDYASAEQLLRTRLQSQPANSEALGILGIVLDQEKKYDEAENVYRRALLSSPPEPALLNNFGNHLLATGRVAEARKTFLKLTTLDPANLNALVQLARIALQQKAANESLIFLNRIPASQRTRPDELILRMQADYLTDHSSEADAILSGLSAAAAADPTQTYALGLALASAHQYAKAQTFFRKTLETRPADFDSLYNLGLAAAHAGDNQGAIDPLRASLAQQPQNVDVLFDLATVNVAVGNKEEALSLLARASRLAPKRTDVLQLEARTSAGLGYFADATHTWDSYLILVPGDDVARRERAFAESATGERMAENLAALTAFVGKHPGDAAGHYELGTAETAANAANALEQLNKALALKPDLTAAHVARGLLLYRQGKTEMALPDYQVAAKSEPDNGAVLDRLGETYLALERTQDALPLLKRAAELEPSNSTVLLHLGRALAKAGDRQEAETVFARCRALGPNRSLSPHPEGLVEFLGLSPDEQRSRYVAGVRHTVQSNPGNAEAQVLYLNILLEDHQNGDAAALVSSLAALKPSPQIVTQAVRSLLAFSEYALAKELLNQAGESPELMLDAAIVDAHLSGPGAGLDALGHVPRANWNGDCDLARAEMLELLNRSEAADLAIQAAIHANPTRSDLYRQTALLLLRDNHHSQATQLLNKAVQAKPDDPEIFLLLAIALDLDGDHDRADKALRSIENRWPEWSKVWIANALILDSRQQPEQARAMRQAAVAMGAPAELAELHGDLVGASKALFPQDQY